MKKKFWYSTMKSASRCFIAFLLFACCAPAQRENTIRTEYAASPSGVQVGQFLIMQLAFMKTDTLDNRAEAYWKLVNTGISSVPSLIEGLTDTTMTSIKSRCKKGGRLNVAEICYFALEEIIELPAAMVTGMQFDVIQEDCWSFYDYFYENKNKPEYQNKVRAFYLATKFKYVNYTKEERNACHIFYKIHGKYRLVN